MCWKGLIFLFAFYPFSTLQIVQPDSLKAKLEELPSDSTKIEIFLQLAGHYIGKEEKLARTYIDSARLVTKNEDYQYGEFVLLEALASFYRSKDYYDSSIFYYNQCLQLSEKNDNREDRIRLLRDLGVVHYYKGDFSEALDIFKTRLQICEDIEDQSCISSSSNNVAVMLTELGNYEEAIRYNLKSLRIDEQTNNQKGVLASHNSLGTVHYYLENYEKSMHHYQQMLEICMDLGDEQLNESYALNNIAGIYYQQKKFQEAIEYYSKSLDIELEYGNKSGIAIKYDNLGSVYQDMNESVKAEDYYRKALAINQEIKNVEGVSSNEYKLAKLYANNGDHKIAIANFLTALIGAKNSGRLALQKDIYDGLAKSYKVLGNYGMALSSYESYISIKDSLLNEESAKQIASLEAIYESEKKEREIALLNQEKELNAVRLAEQEAVVRQRSMQRNLLIGGIISILLISFLFIRNYQLRLRARERIDEQNKELEEMRSRFFASISHEFRTPLTLISAPISELLKKYDDQQETKWTLNLMQQNANQLLRLINQILDLSKLEVGKLELKVMKGDIVSYLRAVAATFDSLAHSKGIQFDQNFAKEPETIFFDKEKLEQIISNLLSNAFKFTPEGGMVQLNTKLEMSKIIIEVLNTGSQISKDDQDKIFERFYQIDSKRQVEGTGIGLALVKELTELHHGKVAVSSDEKQTLFTVCIPIDDSVYVKDLKVEPQSIELKNVKRTRTEDDELVKSATDVDLPRIMLAEDNNDLRSYVKAQLGDSYSVLEAINGHKAFDLALEEIPDLIITDLMMPEMDGEELLEALRNNPKTQHIPVIMLTARADQESKLNNIGKGADHYLNKPFEIDELKVRIRSLLEQRERIRNYHQTQFLTSPKVEDISSSDDLFLQQVGELLQRNLDNSDFTVDEFAQHMSMSRVQLHRKMKAIIGYSASDFIRQYRLKKAYEYLQNKKGTVSEVAYDVGFSNLSYFTKAFKEVYNLKPSELLQKTD